MNLYFVSWQFEGRNYSIDCDEENVAHRLAVAIAESKTRYHVRITPVDVEGHPISDEVAERIYARVQQRIRQLQREGSQ